MLIQFAETILNQLGGCRRVKLMTGAKHFVADETKKTLTISLPRQKAVRITLWRDLYTVELLNLATPAQYLKGKPMVTVAKTEDYVYAHQLRESFTRLTGLELSL